VFNLLTFGDPFPSFVTIEFNLQIYSREDPLAPLVSDSLLGVISKVLFSIR